MLSKDLESIAGNLLHLYVFLLLIIGLIVWIVNILPLMWSEMLQSTAQILIFNYLTLEQFWILLMWGVGLSLAPLYALWLVKRAEGRSVREIITSLLVLPFFVSLTWYAITHFLTANDPSDPKVLAVEKFFDNIISLFAFLLMPPASYFLMIFGFLLLVYLLIKSNKVIFALKTLCESSYDDSADKVKKRTLVQARNVGIILLVVAVSSIGGYGLLFLFCATFCAIFAYLPIGFNLVRVMCSKRLREEIRGLSTEPGFFSPKD